MTETRLAKKIKAAAAEETLEDVLSVSDFTDDEKALGAEAEENPPAQEVVVHEYHPSIEAYINTEGSVTIDLGRQGFFSYASVEELSEILEGAEPEWEPEPSVIGQYRFYRPETNPSMPTLMGQVDAEIGHLNEIRRGLHAKWDNMGNDERNREYERADKEKS